MTLRRVLFRTEAGPLVGLGHLQRCLSLAEALRQRGIACRFAVNAYAAAWVGLSGGEAQRLETEVGSPKDICAGAELAAGRDGIVVVDSYQVHAEYLQALSEAGCWVAAVDDLAAEPFPCRMVVNGSPQADRLPYRSSHGRTRFLLGSRYALLRPELWDAPPRIVRAQMHDVLVTVGGADQYDLMPPIVRALDDALPEGVGVTVVAGPFTEQFASLEACAAQCRHRVVVHSAPASVATLFLTADLAVSAGGQTLYELARAGCPAVVIQTASNQRGQSEAFAQAGCVLLAGVAGAPDLIQRVADGVQQLMADAGLRASMSACGQRLIDGQGAARVAEAMAEQHERETMMAPASGYISDAGGVR